MKLKVPITKKEPVIDDQGKNNRLKDRSYCRGFNSALDELSQLEVCFDLKKMVNTIATYHFELGKRMVLDKGKNEKVSPSRELARSIIAKMENIMSVKRMG